MSPSGIAAVLLLAACSPLLWPERRGRARSAADALAVPAGGAPTAPGPGPGRGPGRGSSASSAALIGWLLRTRAGRLVLSCAAALAVLLVVGGTPGVVVAPAAGAAGWFGLSRLADGRSVAARGQVAGDLPLALDLFAACLRAGRPPDLAAETVGAALTGLVGEQLMVVSRALRLGLPPDQAWSALTTSGLADPAVRALSRCADSGAALAGALSRQADDLRDRRALAARAAVQRAAVLVVLPLGLCFLPAFVCLGVVPLVAGVLARVLP